MRSAEATASLPSAIHAEPFRAPETAPDAQPITLKGHSGARLTLVPRGRTNVVRKTAAAPLANARLMQQCDRQRTLLAHGIPVPRVLESGEDEEGRAFFEMEFVPARTLAATVCDAAPYDRAAVVRALERMLTVFRLTTGAPISADTFHEKISRVAFAAATNPVCSPENGAEIAVTAAQLHACDWSDIPSSPSHGDLTLENILVSPSRGIVFIDCDEPFAMSFWLDIAKLYQDVSGHWCARAFYLDGAAGPQHINATQSLARLKRALGAMVARLAPPLAPRLPALAALHLFRTLPYAQDARLVAFVLARIAKVFE